MNIIAVDDEPIALRDLEYTVLKACEKLTKEQTDMSGINLLCFKVADEVISFAKKNEVHIAFLDINMGSMNGIDLAKSLKGINSNTNIIFVTGHKKYALDAFEVRASDYILKPISVDAITQAINNLRFPLRNTLSKKLKVQCFGNFEVFIDNKPLHFPRKKAKELFAYLIHRKGSGCSTMEITDALFKNKENNLSLQSHVQTVISTMIKVFNDLDITDIIEKKRNNISVNVSKIDCDYLNFLQGDPLAVNSYIGEYMLNYIWAEKTSEQLTKKKEK